MQVKINSVQFRADKKLEDFIGDKLEKLTGFYDQILSSEVFLKSSFLRIFFLCVLTV